MAGSATLNDNVLVDSLVADIDELKADLYADFGVRAFNVHTVLRTWTGAVVGEGDYADVVTTLAPPPLVQQWDGYRWALLAAGVHEDGQIRVTDVSLSYTYAELTGPATIAENQQFFYRLTDAHGQGQEERLLRANRPPQVDREKGMCWQVWLMDMNLSDQAPVEAP
jgi:hypothetical protein